MFVTTKIRGGFGMQSQQLQIVRPNADEDTVSTEEIIRRNRADAQTLYKLLMSNLSNGTYQHLKRLMIEDAYP